MMLTALPEGLGTGIRTCLERHLIPSDADHLVIILPLPPPNPNPVNLGNGF